MKHKTLIKKTLIVGATTAALIVAAIFTILGLSVNSKIEVKTGERRFLETQLSDAHKVIENTRDVTASKHIASLAIDEITRYGSAQKVNFISFSPGEATADKNLRYEVLPVDMQVSGTYQAIGGFLGLLNQLKNGIVTMETLNVFPYSEDIASTCKAEVKLNVYLFKDAITLPQASAKRTVFTTWKKDAFVKKHAPAKAATDFVLNGIMWDEETPQAIINGNVVSPGQTIGTFKVTEIQQETVVLSDGTTHLELKLE